MYQSMPTLRTQSSHRRRNTLKYLILLAFISIIGGLGSAYFGLRYWAAQEIQLSAPIEVKLERGESARAFAKKSLEKGLVTNSSLFYAYLRWFGHFSRFQSGLYRFSDRVSPRSLAEQVVRGEIYEPILLRYTIPEGFTALKFAKRLEAQGIGELKDYLKLYSNQAFLKQLKIPGPNIEGFIYPATYAFKSQINPTTAIEEAVRVFWRELPKDFEESARSKGLSLYEAVVFASLIELETKFDDERGMVSEVIWRRLKNKDALGIDAALIYGIEDYTGDIKWKHLKDRSNPYNTRYHRGLPPTPIGSPSRDSLAAVFNPTNLGYYFYVLDLDQGGRHHFSKSLAEHQRFVKKLVKQLKERQNK